MSEIDWKARAEKAEADFAIEVDLHEEMTERWRAAEAKVAAAWGEGYEAAEHMARCWGHTDHWEDEPANPYATRV